MECFHEGLNGPINAKAADAQASVCACVRGCERKGEEVEREKERDAVNGNKRRENSKHMALRLGGEIFFLCAAEKLQQECVVTPIIWNENSEAVPAGWI